MVQPVEVQITEDVETRVRLHATVQLDDAGGVEALGVVVQVLVGRHLSRDREEAGQTTLQLGNTIMIAFIVCKYGCMKVDCKAT